MQVEPRVRVTKQIESAMGKEVVRLPFDVAHNAEELASLAEQLNALDGETRIVLEHTGRYYEPLRKHWMAN